MTGREPCRFCLCLKLVIFHTRYQSKVWTRFRIEWVQTFNGHISSSTFKSELCSYSAVVLFHGITERKSEFMLNVTPLPPHVNQNLSSENEGQFQDPPDPLSLRHVNQLRDLTRLHVDSEPLGRLSLTGGKNSEKRHRAQSFIHRVVTQTAAVIKRYQSFNLFQVRHSSSSVSAAMMKMSTSVATLLSGHPSSTIKKKFEMWSDLQLEMKPIPRKSPPKVLQRFNKGSPTESQWVADGFACFEILPQHTENIKLSL